MNNDLISRSALQKVFEAECVGECRYCKHIRHNPEGCALIDDAPAVDAEAVRHGEWIPSSIDPYDPYFRCSVCDQGYSTIYHDGEEMNYCPNCGAKMDAEVQDGI